MDTSYLVSQFGNPRGMVGQIVGMAMDLKNRERNDWMVDRLGPRAGEKILEIGCGSGYALRQMATMMGSGHIAGIDRSELMVRRASRGLRAVVDAGRAEVVQGSSERLPWPDGSFDAVCLSNVAMFWEAHTPHLAEIHRVLREGGRIVMVQQPPSNREVSRARAAAERLAAAARATGFANVSTAVRLMKLGPCALVTGSSPATR